MAEPNTPSPTRLPVQFLMVVATLIVWAISPKPELWSLIAAYLFVWLAFNLFAKSRSSIEIPWPRRTVIAVVILILAVPLATLFRFRFDFESAEGFYAFSDLHADRSRLQDLPTISPPTIHYDHPQSHYIYAPETSAVSLDLGSGVVRLSAENLGHGLFRTRYDPRKHGIPQTAMAKIEVRLVADGVAFPRTLDAVRFEAHPRWLSASPERGLAAAVSEETDEIIVISRKGRYRRLPTEDGPSDSTFFANGTRLAIAHRYSPTLQVIEPATGEEIASAEVALFQHRVAAHPHGNRLAVAIAGLEPEIRFLRADSLATEVSVPLPFRPDWMTFGESESSLILSSSENGALYRLSKCGDGWELSEPMSIGSPPVTIARSADGDLIYVAVTDYRPEGAPRGGNHFVDDQILVVDSATLEIVGRRSTGGRDASQDSPGGTNRGVSPVGMAARPGGSLLVAFAGSDEVWETDLFDRIPPIKWSGAEFGLAVPVGIADLGDGSFAVSSPAQGVIAIYSGDGKRRHFLAFAPSDSDLAAHPEGSLGQTSLNIRWGERAFYESTRSGIACQSCHLHGGTDHAFHDIGQGNSPLTLTTRGIAGTKPYLRDASYPRIRDLNNHVAESLYRGYARKDPLRPSDLETYVESLPRTVNPATFLPGNPDRDRAGTDAFVKADCVLCHAFPAFTNLSQHPLPTIFPDRAENAPPWAVLDTPSLIGLWDKGKFFHDGRADRLVDVLGKFNKANRHGNTAALSETERQALADFLLSL